MSMLSNLDLIRRVPLFSMLSAEHAQAIADSVVLAMGQRVDDGLYQSLKGKGPELYRVGDAVAPRKVDMAIWEGHKIGREI